MAIFYVFQGETYKQERAGGYVWSPKLANNGSKNRGYTLMTHIKQGDYILHNCDAQIVAISIAKTDCYDADQPRELIDADKEYEWDIDGYRVDTEYYDFDYIVQTKDHKAWLIEHHKVDSAFTRNGRGKQQYMCNLDLEHAEYLLKAAIEKQSNKEVLAVLKAAYYDNLVK